MVTITNHKEGEIDLLEVNGDVDASSSIYLDEALTALSTREDVLNILVDGRKLNYISSAGLGVFMSYIDEFKEKGIKMIIFGLSDKVKNVFQILGLDQVMIITETKEGAVEKIHEVQS